MGAFLVLGLGRQPLLARYLAVPGSMLALFCAAAVTAWLIPDVRERLGRWAAVVSVAALAAMAVATAEVVPTVRENVDFAAARHRADGDLPAFVDAHRPAFRRCPPQQVSYFQTRPLLAYLLGVRTNSIVRVRASRPVAGTLLLEREADEAPPPAAFGAVAQSRYWRLLSTCGPTG